MYILLLLYYIYIYTSVLVVIFFRNWIFLLDYRVAAELLLLYFLVVVVVDGNVFRLSHCAVRIMPQCRGRRFSAQFLCIHRTAKIEFPLLRRPRVAPSRRFRITFRKVYNRLKITFCVGPRSRVYVINIIILLSSSSLLLVVIFFSVSSSSRHLLLLELKPAAPAAHRLVA